MFQPSDPPLSTGSCERPGAIPPAPTQPNRCTFQPELKNTDKTPNQETFPNLCLAQLQPGLQVVLVFHLSTSSPLPLSPEHERHVTINVCNQISTKQWLSTAVILICQDTRGAHLYSPFITLGQLQSRTPIHTELLLQPCAQSPSRNSHFRSSQLSQRLPHPPRTTNAGFLQGPELFMCRAKRRTAFAEAMNDLSPR